MIVARATAVVLRRGVAQPRPGRVLGEVAVPPRASLPLGRGGAFNGRGMHSSSRAGSGDARASPLSARELAGLPTNMFSLKGTSDKVPLRFDVKGGSSDSVAPLSFGIDDGTSSADHGASFSMTEPGSAAAASSSAATSSVSFSSSLAAGGAAGSAPASAGGDDVAGGGHGPKAIAGVGAVPVTAVLLDGGACIRMIWLQAVRVLD